MCDWVLHLLQQYAAHNAGQVSLAVAARLRAEAAAESYRCEAVPSLGIPACMHAVCCSVGWLLLVCFQANRCCALWLLSGTMRTKQGLLVLMLGM